MHGLVVMNRRDKVVGGICFKHHKPYSSSKHANMKTHGFIEILLVAVGGQWQRCGHGKKLMEHLREHVATIICKNGEAAVTHLLTYATNDKHVSLAAIPKSAY